jgi:pimeloyl-ACP methyl ester carboxylesterase
MLWIILRLRLGPRRLRRKAFMELVLPPDQAKAPPAGITERLAGILGHDVADMPPITSRQMAAMRRHDVTPRLGELAGIPTLVINGAEDMIAPPSSGRAIAAGIPGARFIEIPGAAHAFPVLQPERCGGLVLEHLAKAEHVI